MEVGAVIDVTAIPDLLKLAEEVHTSGRVRVLTRDGYPLARVVPVGRSRRRRAGSPVERRYAAFQSAAGSWADVDTDQLLADIYRDRDRADRPSVDL